MKTKTESKLNTRLFTIDDIDLLGLDTEFLRNKYVMYLKNEEGPAWLIENEDGPICAFGGVIMWEGVAEIWFNLINETDTFLAIRRIKRMIPAMMDKFGAWRLYATVIKGNETGARFVKKMDFVYEGTMRAYYPDKSDAEIYARVRL